MAARLTAGGGSARQTSVAADTGARGAAGVWRYQVRRLAAKHRQRPFLSEQLGNEEVRAAV